MESRASQFSTQTCSAHRTGLSGGGRLSALSPLARLLPEYLISFAVSMCIFFRSVALLGSPITPPVLPGRPYAMVNGAMYTIAYEFRCYLLVALLGLCGLLRRPIPVMIITLLLLFSLLYAAPFERMHWPRHMEALIGQPVYVFRLTAVYLAGCCFYLFRGRIAFRPGLRSAATILMSLLCLRSLQG